MTTPVSESAAAQSAADRVIIFDTTMRDGEQSPGASMSDEKIELAKILEGMKVDVIEAGFPIASNGDFEAVRQIAELVTESTVCGLARAGMADIDRCAEAVKKAKRGRIHTFLSTSPSHRDHILHASQEDILEMITKSVTHARNLCGDVSGRRRTPRAPSRTSCAAASIAIKAGAGRSTCRTRWATATRPNTPTCSAT
jgi:2-isopropylmalate synthase